MPTDTIYLKNTLFTPHFNIFSPEKLAQFYQRHLSLDYRAVSKISQGRTKGVCASRGGKAEGKKRAPCVKGGMARAYLSEFKLNEDVVIRGSIQTCAATRDCSCSGVLASF